MENDVCGINRSVENRKNTAECVREVKTNITTQLFTRVHFKTRSEEMCCSYSRLVSSHWSHSLPGVMMSWRAVRIWKHFALLYTPVGLFFLKFQITLCYVWIILVLCALRRMSNRVSVQRMENKGKVKLDFFLIKAIFWINPFFLFLLCHFIPFCTHCKEKILNYQHRQCFAGSELWLLCPPQVAGWCLFLSALSWLLWQTKRSWTGFVVGVYLEKVIQLAQWID